MELLSELIRAQALLDRGDSQGCLDVLRVLEGEYKKATHVLDLLGDVFIQDGDLQRGTRYKTLFSVLQKVLDAIDDGETQENGRESKCVRAAPVPLTSLPNSFSQQRLEREEGATRQIHEADSATTDFVPVTPAIGKQLMIQGHFDLALSVFERLLTENPRDQDIQQLRDEAAKMKRQERLLEVMRGWLRNIEKMRSQQRNPI
ncbi:MAG: hypothetical protein QG577_2320 [Thermodesulfobacteriota bacterium]|nr:hypothetical protein [Thermodesulfobacteriota bacterium]